MLITRSELAQQLSFVGNVLCLDTDGGRIARHPSTPVRVVHRLDHLAYIIYTSGSSGRPKGVAISHRNLAHYSTVCARGYSLTSEDHVLQFAALSFDVSAEEIFPTLLAGARVVLRSEEIFMEAFQELVERHRLTVLNLPSSFWHEWVASPVRVRLPASLRLLIVGSETTLHEHLIAWRQEVGDRVAWLNAYGTSETTIGATIYRPGPEIDKLRTVPIGRPLEGIQILILDRELRPVPLGHLGELGIAGTGLARGYFDRPALSAARFVPHPDAHEAGARLYRTGDLARFLTDGNIEFLGRVDDQIKIHGVRIELGEIEATLRTHPTVREALVLTRDERPTPEILNRLLQALDPEEAGRFLAEVSLEPIHEGFEKDHERP